MNILLLSSLVGSKKAFEKFIKNCQTSEITFIATAAENESYTKYVDDARSYLKELGFKIKELEVSKIDEEKSKEILKNTEFLYVSGGNTFYLLQELQKKNLLGYINQRVNEGMIYVGESAGSIIASPDIEYIKYMDDPKAAPELKSKNALNLVDFYTLPHWGEEPFKEAAEKIRQIYADSLELVAIDNKSAIRCILNNSYELYLGDDF